MHSAAIGIALAFLPWAGAFHGAASAAPPPPNTPSISILGDKRTIGTTLTAAGTAKANQPASGSRTVQSTSGAPIDPCFYTPIAATAGDPRLGGADPNSGVLYIVSCPDALDVNSGRVLFAPEGTIWTPNGTPPTPPPPNPATIAQEAAGTMTAPNPVIHLGPNTDHIAVKVPVWLWIDKPQPITMTVAVRGLSVTVTATQTSTTWTMGEGDQTGPTTTHPPITCTGTGTPPPPHPPRTLTPPCGYTYTWKSLPERTNGTGTYQITATTNWHVTWTATNNTNGTLPTPLTPTATQHITVGEWRTELVSGN